MSLYTKVEEDPGIFGFVKAHQHQSGCALVMNEWETEDEEDCISIFWVCRLNSRSKPMLITNCIIYNEDNRWEANYIYETCKKNKLPPAIADIQRQKVYNWENYIFRNEKILKDRSECDEFLKTSWKIIGKRKRCPLLICDKKRSKDFAFSLNGAIHLPQNEKFYRKTTILHEITHEILPLFVNHSPFFVQTAIDLYSKILGYSKIKMQKEADNFGVKYGPEKWIAYKSK